ncbi:MAG: VPLPA-CTERM sorting domain-containing protein [Desulfamplus sp.]
MKKGKILMMACFLICSIFAVASSAMAVTYNFWQDGYSGGGKITGSFDAEDSDHNGYISTFNSEVTNFNLSFSGNLDINPFALTFDNLTSLIYKVGGNFIGDDTLENISGGSVTSLFKFDLYTGGIGLGGVEGTVSQNWELTTTQQLINITPVSSPVPVPAAVWLFGSGLIGLAGIKKSLSFRKKVFN